MDDKPISIYFMACFKTPAGKKVLEYLERQTIRRITSSEISNDELRCLEGQRQLVQQIFNFIKLGEQKHD